MSKITLSAQCATCVADAASAEHSTRDKWSNAGKALAKSGVTSPMLVKSTETSPNDAYDAELWETIRGFIITGVSASKKACRLSTPVPGSISADAPKGSTSWSVADLMSLTREQLREIDDDVLKTQRRVYMQLIDGTMFARIRMYVDKANGVERRPRDKKAESTTSPETSTDPIVQLQALLAIKTKLVSMSDINRFENAILEAIACLRAK